MKPMSTGQKQSGKFDLLIVQCGGSQFSTYTRGFRQAKSLGEEEVGLEM